MVATNNAKYVFILIVVGVCTPYIIIGLNALKIDPLISGYFWVFYIVIWIFFFTYFPMREYKIHQGATFGKTFTQGPIIYLNHTTRYVLLGHEGEIEEIRLAWDDQDLKVKEHSKLYYRAKMTVLKNETREEKETRQMYKVSKDVEDLVKGLEYDPSAPPISQVAQRLSELYHIEVEIPENIKRNQENSKEELESDPEAEIEKPKIINAELSDKSGGGNGDNNEDGEPFDMAKYKENLLLEKPGEIVKGKKGKEKLEIKLEAIDFDSLGFTSEEQKKILESMYIYKIDLYHPETLEGYEHIEFEQVFYILPGPFDEILKPTEMDAFDYSDYPVKVQGCEVMWCCLGFIKGKIPLLMCMYSENLIKFQTEDVINSSKLKSSAIYYLRLKIMEFIIDELIAEQDPFEKILNTYEQRNEGLSKRLDYVTQEYLADSFIKAPVSVQRELQKRNEELGEMKKWKPIALFSIIICLILMFALFFVILPLTAGSGVQEPPPEKEACLIFNLFQILIYNNFF